MRRRLLSPTLALCLAMVIAGSSPGFAQQVRPLDPEWLQKMYAEGWHKIQEGVLQRDAGKGQLETFGYGAEGLEWVVQEYEQRVQHLQARNERSPGATLAPFIAQLKREIARLSESLVDAPAASLFDGQALESCTPDYDWNLYAGPKAGSSGVVATAEAYFHSDCDQRADVSTTAHAQAIQGTLETFHAQSHPLNNGSWIDSRAEASANGSTGCESWAQASVTSNALNIYCLSPLVQNFTCSTKLIIDPSRITLDGPQSDGDPSRLADEQAAAGDPRAGAGNPMTTAWSGTNYNAHANAAIIDLGAVYRIERIYLYDTNGIGPNFTVTAGSPASGWTNTLISDPLSDYLAWKGFPNDPATDHSGYTDDPALEFQGVTTRYLRVVNPTAYLGMNEIIVYGTPVP